MFKIPTCDSRVYSSKVVLMADMLLRRCINHALCSFQQYRHSKIPSLPYSLYIDRSDDLRGSTDDLALLYIRITVRKVALEISGQRKYGSSSVRARWNGAEADSRGYVPRIPSTSKYQRHC
jgi:hypothetical protein